MDSSVYLSPSFPWSAHLIYHHIFKTNQNSAFKFCFSIWLCDLLPKVVDLTAFPSHISRWKFFKNTNAGIVWTTTQNIILLVCLFFQDRFSVCNSPSCPGNHSVKKAGLKLTEIYLALHPEHQNWGHSTTVNLKI